MFNQKGGLIWIHFGIYFKVLVDTKLPFKFVLNWFKILNNLKNHLKMAQIGQAIF